MEDTDCSHALEQVDMMFHISSMCPNINVALVKRPFLEVRITSELSTPNQP